MSKQHDKFADWLDGKVNAEQLASDLGDDPLWLQRFSTAQQVQHQADMSVSAKVPNWDRGATFEQEKKHWWQWQGLPVTSMAFSLCAMMLVIFKVEFNVNDNGFVVSFASTHQQNMANIDALVERRVSEQLAIYDNQQQVVLANYAADIKAQQQNSNLELASYIMGSTRKERKEDFADFISYVSDQRRDDKLSQQIQYQQLAQAIRLQQVSSKEQPLSLQPANLQYQE